MAKKVTVLNPLATWVKGVNPFQHPVFAYRGELNEERTKLEPLRMSQMDILNYQVSIGYVLLMGVENVLSREDNGDGWLSVQANEESWEQLKIEIAPNAKLGEEGWVIKKRSHPLKRVVPALLSRTPMAKEIMLYGYESCEEAAQVRRSRQGIAATISDYNSGNWLLDLYLFSGNTR